MGVETEIEMACINLVEKHKELNPKTNAVWFKRNVLRYHLKDVLSHRYSPARIERAYNKMLQEGNYKIFLNKEGYIEVKKSSNNVEKYYVEERIPSLKRIVVTIFEFND